MSAALAISTDFDNAPFAANDNVPLWYNMPLGCNVSLWYNMPLGYKFAHLQASNIITLYPRSAPDKALPEPCLNGPALGAHPPLSQGRARVSGSANLSGQAGVNGARGAANGNYTYDGNLKRVKSVVNGKTIYNIYDASGTLVHVHDVSANQQTSYVSVNGMTVARIGNNFIPSYVHNDHQGSPRMMSSNSGAALGGSVYTPFGEEWQVAAPPDQAGYTGHLKDSATGLNYMQARYYDPVIGRFLSVDPVTFMDSGGDPRYFNRYAYTANDPINATDPTGRQFRGNPMLAQAALNDVKNGTTNATDSAKVGVVSGSVAVGMLGCAMGGCVAAAPYVSTAFTTSNTTMAGMAVTSAAISGTSTAISGGDASQIATSGIGAGVTTAVAVKSGNIFQAALVFFGGGTTTAAMTDLIDGQQDSTDGSYLATGVVNTVTGILPVVPPTVSTATGAVIDAQVQEAFQTEEKQD